MENQEPDEFTKYQWSNDPDNWIWGIFYFNKQDNRILLPKRIPILGWTLNFAHPVSVIVFGILILSIMLAVFYG